MRIQKAIRTADSIGTVLVHANEFDEVAIVTIGCTNFIFLATDELNHRVKDSPFCSAVWHTLTVFVRAIVRMCDVFCFS